MEKLDAFVDLYCSNELDPELFNSHADVYKFCFPKSSLLEHVSNAPVGCFNEQLEKIAHFLTTALDKNLQKDEESDCGERPRIKTLVEMAKRINEMCEIAQSGFWLPSEVLHDQLQNVLLKFQVALDHSELNQVCGNHLASWSVRSTDLVVRIPTAISAELNIVSKLNELFQHMGRSIFGFQMMSHVSEMAKELNDDFSFGIDIFERAAECLVIAKSEVDIRIFAYYVQVFKTVFLRVREEDLKSAMMTIYEKPYFRDSSDHVPALRENYQNFDNELQGVLSAIFRAGETLLLGKEFSSLCKQLSFYMTMAPKPVIRTLIVTALNDESVASLIIEVLRRIPAFFTIRIPKVGSSGPESELLILTLFRRLICTEYINQPNKMERIRHMLLELTRSKILKGEIVPPIFNATDLIRDLVIDVLDKSVNNSAMMRFFSEMLPPILHRNDSDTNFWDISWQNPSTNTYKKPFDASTVNPLDLQNALFHIYQKGNVPFKPTEPIVHAYGALYKRLKLDNYSMSPFECELYEEIVGKIKREKVECEDLAKDNSSGVKIIQRTNQSVLPGGNVQSSKEVQSPHPTILDETQQMPIVTVSKNEVAASSTPTEEMAGNKSDKMFGNNKKWNQKKKDKKGTKHSAECHNVEVESKESKVTEEPENSKQGLDLVEGDKHAEVNENDENRAVAIETPADSEQKSGAGQFGQGELQKKEHAGVSETNGNRAIGEEISERVHFEEAKLPDLRGSFGSGRFNPAMSPFVPLEPSWRKNPPATAIQPVDFGYYPQPLNFQRHPNQYFNRRGGNGRRSDRFDVPASQPPHTGNYRRRASDASNSKSQGHSSSSAFRGSADRGKQANIPSRESPSQAAVVQWAFNGQKNTPPDWGPESQW